MPKGPKPLTYEQIAATFWQRFEKQGDCLVWTGSCQPSGYGQIQARGIDTKPIFTHRFAWRIYWGEWPILDVLHTCDNPPCAKREHLFVGTAKDNAQDSMAKGRWKIGGNWRRFLA